MLNSFNLAPDNPALLTIRHLKKIVPTLKVPLSIISGVRTNFMTLPWAVQTLLSPVSSKDPKMSKQGTVGKRKSLKNFK
jgi:hypothetical protein